MNNKSIILTSSGLQNIIPDKENEFKFILDGQELKLHKIFAEFISPLVSKIHRSDPTISSIDIKSFFNENPKNDSNLNELFTEDIISILQKISIGFSAEISEEQSHKLRLISIIFGNEELYSKINEIFPKQIEEKNIHENLQELINFYYYSPKSNNFEYSRYIDFISSHFYLIDKKELINLPKPILYSIVSNQNLKIESEDSLLDFIYDIFPNQEYEDEYEEEEEIDDNFSIVNFYEKVEFIGLSEGKFRYFLKYLDSNEITNELWRKLCPCFYVNIQSSRRTNRNRYFKDQHIEKKIEYDGNSDHCFQGIIHHLTELSGGNIADKGIIGISSSSINKTYYPKYVVDLDDKTHYFQSEDRQDAWIKFDFKDRKIRPSHYSIRTRHDWGKSGSHLKNWAIEGSNSNKPNDWKVLDSRSDISCLDDANAMNTFDITAKLEPDECFQYLRLRITGVNTDNKHFIFLSALEFFGSLIEIDK